MPQAALLTELGTAFAFTNSIVADAHTVDATGQYTKPQDVRSFMTEAAVLKMYIAWESYLERSFLNYLMGSPSVTGNVVTRYLTAPTMEHASQVLVGTQRFVDWSNPEIVRRLAKLYFPAGVPYEASISGIQTELLDLKAIRNASAHLSTSTSDQVDKVALRRLGTPVIGISVYTLITAIDPHAQNKTLLQSFQDTLAAAATQISKA